MTGQNPALPVGQDWGVEAEAIYAFRDRPDLDPIVFSRIARIGFQFGSRKIFQLAKRGIGHNGHKVGADRSKTKKGRRPARVALIFPSTLCYAHLVIAGPWGYPVT